QLCRRMNATPGMADERSFEMDPQRARTSRVAVIVPDRFAKMFQRSQRLWQRSSHRGGQITRDAALKHTAFYRCERGRIQLHHIVAGAAVNMYVNEAGNKNLAGKIVMTRTGRDAVLFTWAHRGDETVFDDQYRMFNSHCRGKKLGCRDCRLHKIRSRILKKV